MMDWVCCNNDVQDYCYPPECTQCCLQGAGGGMGVGGGVECGNITCPPDFECCTQGQQEYCYPSSCDQCCM
jgi:hypothetical protein